VQQILRDGPIFGFPRSVRQPFRWSDNSTEIGAIQTFDDLVELLEQLETQSPSNVVIQADAGIINALKLCRVVSLHTKAPIHIVAHGVSEQQEVAARAIGVASIHEVTSGYSELYQQLASRRISGKARHIVVGTLDIDLARRKVVVGSTQLTLTKTEFEILRMLAETPGEVATRQELMDRVWGDKWFGAPNVLDTHLAHLRSKFLRAGHPDALVTVRGIGFYFEPQYVREQVADNGAFPFEARVAG
jgi:DNA-binding response OmpR family regulator